MTVKSTKPTKSTEDAPVGANATGTAAATSAANAVRGASKARSAKNTAQAPKPRQKPPVANDDAKAKRKPRTDTKQARLVTMLQAKNGATVEEIAAAFGWQNHTVRGALYGALKKKLGLDIVSEKVGARGRTYRIGS